MIEYSLTHDLDTTLVYYTSLHNSRFSYQCLLIFLPALFSKVANLFVGRFIGVTVLLQGAKNYAC